MKVSDSGFSGFVENELDEDEKLGLVSDKTEKSRRNFYFSGLLLLSILHADQVTITPPLLGVEIAKNSALIFCAVWFVSTCFAFYFNIRRDEANHDRRLRKALCNLDLILFPYGRNWSGHQTHFANTTDERWWLARPSWVTKLHAGDGSNGVLLDAERLAFLMIGGEGYEKGWLSISHHYDLALFLLVKNQDDAGEAVWRLDGTHLRALKFTRTSFFLFGIMLPILFVIVVLVLSLSAIPNIYLG